MFTKPRLLLLVACIAVAAGVFARGGLNSTPTVARAQTTPPTPLCTALATDAAYGVAGNPAVVSASATVVTQIVLTPTLTVAVLLAILALVNAGMGLALVPRCDTSEENKNQVFRDIELAVGVQSELHLIWRENNDNPAFAMFLEGNRSAVREGSGV